MRKTGIVARASGAPGTARPRAVGRGGWARKNMLMDQQKLDRAKAILGAPTETAAVDAALDLVAFRGEVLAGWDRLIAAGGLADVFRDR